MRSPNLTSMLAAMAVVAAACTSGDSDPEPTAATQAPAASGPTDLTTEATLLESPDGRLSIELPAGAVAADADLGIELVDPATVPWLEGTQQLGAVYRLRPEGLTFPVLVPLVHQIPLDETGVDTGAVPLATTLIGSGEVVAFPVEQRVVVEGSETYVHFSEIDRFGVVALIDGGVTMTLEPPRGAFADGESFDVALTTAIDRDGPGAWPSYDLDQRWSTGPPISGGDTETVSVTSFGDDEEPWVVERTYTCDIAGDGIVRVEMAARVTGAPEPRSTTVVVLDSEFTCGDVGR